MRCRLCDSNRLLSVLDLGATPPCETFLTADELDAPEPTFPLHLRLCEDCLLLADPCADHARRKRSPSTHTSRRTRTAGCSTRRGSSTTPRNALDSAADSFVVEVASNDGYLLQHAVAAGIPCLGIEPSVNVGAAARERGVPTATAFLDEQLAAAVCGRARSGRPRGRQQRLRPHSRSARLHPIAARAAGRRRLVEHRGAPRAEPRRASASSTRSTTSTSSTTQCCRRCARSPPPVWRSSMSS